MAQAPRRMMTGRVAVEAMEQRYAAAGQATAAAENVVVETSAKHLAGLLRGRPEARFAALAESGSVLTPEDRAKLVASLKGQATSARPISAGTASRLAILRSRLPYRVVPIMVRVLSSIAVVVLGLLAWHRTPEQWVTIRASAASSTQWRLPDGTTSTGAPTKDTRYTILRRDGEIGVLRAWLPGRGYAEAHVAIDDLQAAR